MLTFTHTHARPFGQLLRRLLAAGIPIGEVPDETTRMEACGDIEYRGRLRPPEKWWLVELSSGKLLIMTEDSSRLLDPTEPIDPFQILYVERLQPPIVIVPPSAKLRDRETPTEEQASTTPAKPRRVRGKHKSDVQKIADAKEVVAAVDDYVKKHKCSKKDAFAALWHDLRNNSAAAAKTAYYAAKALLRASDPSLI